MKKLSKQDIKKKKEYHNKRAKYYDKKLNEVTKEEKRIGFKFY